MNAITRKVILLILVRISVGQVTERACSSNESSTVINGNNVLKADMVLIGKIYFQEPCESRDICVKSFKLNDNYRVYFLFLWTNFSDSNFEIYIGSQRCTLEFVDVNCFMCNPSVVGSVVSFRSVMPYAIMHLFGTKSSLDLVVKYQAETTSLNGFTYISPIEMSFNITDDEMEEQTIHMHGSEKYCLSVDNREHVYFSTEGSECLGERLVLNVTQRINEYLINRQIFNSCMIADADFRMMLVAIKTNSSNASSESNLYFLLNGQLEFSFKGIIPGRTQIFLVSTLQLQNISSLEVSAHGYNKLILNEIVLLKDFLFEERFVHYEVLTRQIYYVNKQKSAAPSNITIATGRSGTDDGVVLKLYFTKCETNVTLDTPADNFKPNSTDVFNVSLPLCGTLHCIKLYQLMSTSEWDVRNITIYYGYSYRFLMIGRRYLLVNTLYCRNNVNRDGKNWTVTIYNSVDVTNKLTLRLIGVDGSSEMYFLNENNQDDTYESKYNFINSNIGDWYQLSIIAYRNVTISNGFQLILNESTGQQMNFTVVGESSAQTVYFTAPCRRDAHVYIEQYFLTSCFEDNVCLYEPDFGDGIGLDVYFKDIYLYQNSKWFLQIINITQDNVILNIIVNNIITSYGPSTISSERLELNCNLPNSSLEDEIHIRLFPGGKCDAVRINLLWIERNDPITYYTQLLESVGYCEWLVGKYLTTSSAATTTTSEITTEEATQLKWMNKATSITTESEYTTDTETTTNHEEVTDEVNVVTESPGVDINTDMPDKSNKTDKTNETDASYTTEDYQNNGESRTEPVFMSDGAEYASSQKTTPRIATTEHGTTRYNRSKADSTVAIRTTIPNRLVTTNTTEIPITHNTRPVENATVELLCSCPCNKQPPMKNLTSKEIHEKLEQLASELTIPRNKTSKYKRSKISAPDERESSLYISSFIVMIVTLPFVLIILLDLLPLLKWFCVKCL